MVKSTSAVMSHSGMRTDWPRITIASAAAAQPAMNQRPGSVMIGAAAGIGPAPAADPSGAACGITRLSAHVRAPLTHPGEDSGQRHPQRDWRDRHAGLQQQAGGQDAGPDEELPAPYHSMTTNTAASISRSATAGGP